MKKKKLFKITFTVALLIISIAAQPADTFAAANKYSYCPKSIGGKIFRLVNYKGDDYFFGKLYLKEKGHTTLLSANVNESYISNGKYLFYAKKGKRIYDSEWDWNRYNHTIYRINLKTKKKKKIVSGYSYIPIGCSGNWLYAGTDNLMDGVKLYAINIKNGKKRYMDNFVDSVQCAKGRVLINYRSGDLSPGGAITIFKENGKKLKSIQDSFRGKIKGKTIYYARVKYSSDKTLFRVYRCNLNGNKKKAVTKWSTKYPDKYID